MGWSLAMGHSPTAGLSFWDVRFQGQRVLWELSLQVRAGVRRAVCVWGGGAKGRCGALLECWRCLLVHEFMGCCARAGLSLNYDVGALRYCTAVVQQGICSSANIHEKLFVPMCCCCCCRRRMLATAAPPPCSLMCSTSTRTGAWVQPTRSWWQGWTAQATQRPGPALLIQQRAAAAAVSRGAVQAAWGMVWCASDSSMPVIYPAAAVPSDHQLKLCADSVTILAFCAALVAGRSNAVCVCV
jgi:hypothetical protein